MRTFIVRRFNAWMWIAALVFAAVSNAASAHTFCVADSATFRLALAAVSDGGTFADEANVIQMAAGTYATTDINDRFVYVNASATGSIAISGGFDVVCATQQHDATLTVLDGARISQVMVLRSSAGDVSLSWLSVTNAETTQPGGGLGINDIASTSGGVYIYDTIITGNHTTSSHGGLRAYTYGNHPLYFDNNLVAFNSADGNFSAGSLIGGAAVYLRQNTIAENFTAGTGISGMWCLASPRCIIANNIAWENPGGDFYLGSAASLVYNDYTTSSGTTPTQLVGNVSTDPYFTASMAGDFHLYTGSPVFALSEYSGSYSGLDLEGRPLPTSGRIDLGAYSETIFSDGNEL